MRNFNDIFDNQLFVGGDALIKRFSEITDLINDKVGTISYPPYNLIKTEDGYTIEMALAGFGKDDFEVVIEDNILKISSVLEKNDKSKNSYIWQGISARNFQRKFALEDNLELKSAEFKNGMLHIIFTSVVPKRKTKKIKIN